MLARGSGFFGELGVAGRLEPGVMVMGLSGVMTRVWSLELMELSSSSTEAFIPDIWVKLLLVELLSRRCSASVLALLDMMASGVIR